MFKRLFVIAAGLACATALFGATAKEAVLIPRENSGKPLPRFSNGFMIFYDRDLQTVLSYDTAGTLKTQASLVLPDASKISITDVTASKDGTLAVAASVVSGNGQHLSSVVFWINSRGQIDRTVRTTPFAAARVLFAPNGHLWAVGRVHDETFQDTPKYDVLREYDAQGGLVRTMLSTESFKTSSVPKTRDVMLVANQDKIGVYLQAVGEYIEFDLSGNQNGRWVTPEFPKVKAIEGAALTSMGALCVGGLSGKGKAVAYCFEKASGKFLPIDLPMSAGAARLLALRGAEGNDLVFYGKPASIIRVSAE